MNTLTAEIGADKISSMAKKQNRIGRPPKNPSLEKGKRSTILVQGRIDPWAYEQFMEYIADLERKLGVKTEKSSHLQKAMIDYLKANGWKFTSPVPPKPADEVK